MKEPKYSKDTGADEVAQWVKELVAQACQPELNPWTLYKDE